MGACRMKRRESHSGWLLGSTPSLPRLKRVIARLLPDLKAHTMTRRLGEQSKFTALRSLQKNQAVMSFPIQ